ncbi:MAG: tetratricopeptide repeat protein [Candidatus Hydrogenedens sp.]|jgi:4-amino-4-deoxy-L-arabinose transferase-like glycosyltransferase|nr:tetratricopeptide repeat protein [Candidatus Hydrogenedens sp.]
MEVKTEKTETTTPTLVEQIRKGINSLFAKEARPYWIVFILALIIRSMHQGFIQNNDPMFGYLLTGGDNHTFDRWALEISQTFWLGWDRTPFFHGPLYPYILGIFYLRFGHSPFTASWMQHGMGAVIVVLIFFLARRTFDKKSGWMAALIALFCPIFLLYESEILSDTLILLTNLLVLVVAFHTAKKPGKRSALLLGLALGLCILGRPNALLFIPLIILWLLIIVRQNWKQKAVAALIFVAATGACILPATCANYFVGKHFALVSWSGPFNTYIGNAPDGTGVFWSPPSMQEIRKNENKEDLEIDWSAYLLEALREDPLLLPRSLWMKFKLFWQSGEIPHNINVYLKKPFSPFLRIPLYWGLIAPLGLAGMLSALLRKRQFSWRDPDLILIVFFLTYMTSIVLVFVLARLRMPALAILIIFAAGALSRVYQWGMEAWRQRKMTPLLMAGLLLLVWGGGAWLLKSRDDSLLLRWNDYFNLGSAYQSQGKLEEALEQYEKAVERAPEILAIRGVRDDMRRQLEKP